MKNHIITSKEIANLTGKQNKDIIKKIRAILLKFPNANTYFIEDFYKYKMNNNAINKAKCYKCTLEGVKLLIDDYNKTPKLKPLIEWYNSEIKSSNEIIVLKSRFEDSFINKLTQALTPLGCTLTEQKPVFCGRYRIDAYIEELKIAIEYDEEQHKFNKKQDLIRQEEIQKELGCIFIRCNYENSDAYNIGLVIKEIIHSNLTKNSIIC